MVHPSQTLWSQWSYYPSTLTGDPHVEAVRNEFVYSGYPDCIYLWFSTALTSGLAIHYDFPAQVLKPLRIRVFARTGSPFPYQGQFTYRLTVQTYSASDVLLEQWVLDEGSDFPHYDDQSNPLPSLPNLIPMATLMPTQPWKRLRLIGSIVGWNNPFNVLPTEVTAGDPGWSELSVSYIETEFAARGLRLRPLTGASV